MKLIDSLILTLKATCAAVPDSRKGRKGNIDIADFGLAAFAMFFMQSVSFLAFQRRLESGRNRRLEEALARRREAEETPAFKP